MKIYVAHARSFAFKTKLYKPIKNSLLSKKHTFIFPHGGGKSISSKVFFKRGCDLIVAEVSHPATGVGIELGWADMLRIPIICIYKKGSRISNSLKNVTTTFLEYSDETELITKLTKVIEQYKK